MLKWISKHKIIIFSILFIGALIGIAVISGFIVHCNAPHCPSQISADGMLSYIGSVITAIGSIIVAIVAVWQTKKANDLSKSYNEIAAKANESAKIANKLTERAQNLEEWHYKMEIRPFVLVSKLEYEELKLIDIAGKTHLPIYKINKPIDEIIDDEPLDKVYGILWITFSNTTNSLITVQMEECEDVGTGETWQYSQINNVLRKIAIDGNGNGVVGLFAEKQLWSYIDSYGINLKLILENRFAERYQENVELKLSPTMKANAEIGSQAEDSKDIFYSAQNYKIGKFNEVDEVEWEMS